MLIRFKRLPSAAGIPLPSYETNGSAGMDLRAAVSDVLFPGERVPIQTGLCVAIPDGFEGQVRPRSGLAVNRGVTVLNTPGTIDSDYRGELCVILINHGSDVFVIERGDRIAQLVIAAVSRCEAIEADDLDDTDRGSGGFGSTGV